MKKNILLLSLAFVLLSASGCSLKGQFKDEADVTSQEGVLSEQKITDKLGGSHILTLDSGEKLALRSLAIDMSQDEYLGNKVSVLGFLNDDDEVFEVTGISVLEILSPAAGVGKLVSYKNSDFGFSLKFYDDWRFEEDQNKVTFFAPGSDEALSIDTVIIEHFPFNYSPTLYADGSEDDPLSAYFKQNNLDVKDLSKKKVKVGLDQLDAIRQEFESGKVEYFLYRSGLIYTISFVPVDPLDTSNKNVFLEMLADFQFIGFSVEDELGEGSLEGDDTTFDLEDFGDMELATFESLPYKFSGKYPADWFYAGVKSQDAGVLHHYAFSNESVTDDNELVGLDIISVAMPIGRKINISGRSLTVIESSSGYSVYTSVGDQNFRVSGDKQYEDIITVIAASISAAGTE